MKHKLVIAMTAATLFLVGCGQRQHTEHPPSEKTIGNLYGFRTDLLSLHYKQNTITHIKQ